MRKFEYIAYNIFMTFFHEIKACFMSELKVD